MVEPIEQLEANEKLKLSFKTLVKLRSLLADPPSLSYTAAIKNFAGNENPSSMPHQQYPNNQKFSLPPRT